MGYAYTFPYSQITLGGRNSTTFTVTNVAGDKSFDTITIPNFQGALSQAYIDFCFQMIRDNSGAFNKVTGGTYGILDSTATYRSGGSFQDGFAGTDGGVTRYQQLEVIGYTNIATYINKGDTITPYLDNVTATADNIQFKDIFPRLRLYLSV